MTTKRKVHAGQIAVIVLGFLVGAVAYPFIPGGAFAFGFGFGHHPFVRGPVVVGRRFGPAHFSGGFHGPAHFSGGFHGGFHGSPHFSGGRR